MIPQSDKQIRRAQWIASILLVLYYLWHGLALFGLVTLVKAIFS